MPKKDFTQVAFDVMRQATREEPKPAPKPATAKQAAGQKGAQVRKQRLDPAKRSEIAKNAATARWKKSSAAE